MLLGQVLAALRATLAASWSDPGRSWSLLGPAWGSGLIFGSLGGTRLSWDPSSAKNVVCFLFVLYMFVKMHGFEQIRYLERSGSCFGSSWNSLGAVLAALGALLGSLLGRS